jgi:hypothetical protein
MSILIFRQRKKHFGLIPFFVEEESHAAATNGHKRKTLTSHQSPRGEYDKLTSSLSRQQGDAGHVLYYLRPKKKNKP